MLSMTGSGVLHEKAVEVIARVAGRDSEKKDKVLSMFVGLLGDLYGNVYTDWLRNNYEYVSWHSLGVARYIREHRKDTNFIHPRQEAIIYDVPPVVLVAKIFMDLQHAKELLGSALSKFSLTGLRALAITSWP